MTRSCRSCLHWDSHREPDDAPPTRGYCRRRAPTVIVELIPNPPGSNYPVQTFVDPAVWPVTGADDVCGEWRFAKGGK